MFVPLRIKGGLIHPAGFKLPKLVLLVECAYISMYPYRVVYPNFRKKIMYGVLCILTIFISPLIHDTKKLAK